MLLNYSLVDANEEGCEFAMHSSCSSRRGSGLKQPGSRETIKQQHIERMAAAFPTAQHENWRIPRHAQAALEHRLDRR